MPNPEVKMWTDYYGLNSEPKLITVKKAFSDEQSTYLNLDSYYDNGWDEYIRANYLFESDAAASNSLLLRISKQIKKLERALTVLKLRKTELWLKIDEFKHPEALG